jgi:multidrug efflux system membrane fusion protein
MDQLARARHTHGHRRFSRLFQGALLGAALLLNGCEKPLDTRAHAQAEARPKVTVAKPELGSVADFGEYTGRTEAPSAVDIRPRASGHLTRVAFHEGDLIKKGDLLYVIDPRPYETALSRAKAELESTRVDLELAHKNLQRADALYKTGTIPEREWDTRSAAVSQLAARRAVVSANIESAQLDLEYAHIRSPIDGRIGRTLITVGNLVGPETASPLATVVSVDPLYVYIDVDETRALSLGRRDGRVAQVGFPGETGYPHTAKIDFVDNRIDPRTGTLKVRAVVDNHDGRLSHGLFARVRLPESELHQALMVADRAVATDQDKRYVWVVGDDGKAQYRGVKLGRIESGLRVIDQGLTASDRVVVHGLQRVRAGTLVAPELVSMRALDLSPATAARSER